MKQFVFVYSRTKRHDYRVLSGLSDDTCPSDVRGNFVQRIRNLVKTSEGMDAPQWLLVKEKGYVLWGLACMNEMLDETYSQDEFPRPIRCFTGIVIPNYTGEALPYDLEFFKAIFREVMVPIFDSFTGRELKDKLVEVSNVAKCIYPSSFDNKLNTDYHYCRLFAPSTNAELLVASCLSCPDDISIAVNVARRDSVLATEFNPLLNAVMRDGVFKESEDVAVMHECKDCHKPTPDLKNGLCFECWDKQHPHCCKCGKETPELHDGLCQKCYDNEHPRCANCGIDSAYLRDGLCPNCWEKDNIFCDKCKKEMDFHTKNNLCEECTRKRFRQYLLYVAAIVLLVVAFFVVRQCRKTSDIPLPSQPAMPEKNNPADSQPPASPFENNQPRHRGQTQPEDCHEGQQFWQQQEEYQNEEPKGLRGESDLANPNTQVVPQLIKDTVVHVVTKNEDSLS